MKGKKTAQPRRRISFAVDRDEIDINSDWVRAVMAVPAPPAPAAAEVFPAPSEDPPVAVVPAPIPASEAALFFGPAPNTATDEETATVERCTPVEKDAAVVNNAAVAESAPVVNRAPGEFSATVANSATDRAGNQWIGTPEAPAASINDATVALSTTDASYATGEIFTSTKDHRRPRPRPIRRVTDGLTPGQYAVYSLMYEAGEPAEGTHHIYKGGYADLCRLTGLSKRGIQNIVAELQSKKVITIHQAPGYHRTETSAYLIPDSARVLAIWHSNGWRFALGKSKTLSAAGQQQSVPQ